MVDISAIAVDQEPGAVRVSATIKMPELEGEAWFLLPADSGTDIDAASDAFFIVGLILAMSTDGELNLPHPVSKQLRYNSRAAQDILLGWYPRRLSRATLNVSDRPAETATPQDATVSCFTGGVDSFHSFLSNREDVEALLYVHGFDIPLSREELRASTSAHLRDVAASTGKELVEVSTNIRVFLNEAATWPTVTHGAALASVGQLLRGRFGRLIIPASHTYSDGYSWGSHPLLDHNWSSQLLDVVHDGAGSTRVDKTKYLAFDPVARKHLRVCWQNTGEYNCGKCAKCVRTMVALSLSGVLAEFETFESEVSLDAIRALSVTGKSDESFVLENLEYAKEQDATEIAEILQEKITEFRAARRKARLAARKAAAPPKVRTGPSPAELRRSLTETRRSLKETRRQLAASEQELERLNRMLPLRTWMRISKFLHRTPTNV